VKAGRQTADGSRKLKVESQKLKSKSKASKSKIKSPPQAKRGLEWGTRARRSNSPEYERETAVLLGTTVVLSLYFQDSKLGMATVKSGRNLYFGWNEKLMEKMTILVS